MNKIQKFFTSIDFFAIIATIEFILLITAAFAHNFMLMGVWLVTLIISYFVFDAVICLQDCMAIARDELQRCETLNLDLARKNRVLQKRLNDLNGNADEIK